MAASEYLPFATGLGANVINQATYTGLSGRTAGFVAGTAVSAYLNKVWRQGSMGAGVIGQFSADLSSYDALDNGDLPAFVDNFKRAYRSQKTNYVAAGGSANILTLTLAPATLNYTELSGTPIRVRLGFTNTSSSVTINVNGLGARTLVRRDGSSVLPGDLIAGRTMQIAYDEVASNFYLLSVGFAEVPVSTPVGVNPIIYVRTDGNDNNDGSANSAGSALATINRAVAIGTAKYNLSGKKLLIQLGNAGTYAPFNISNVPAIEIIGLDASPGSYLIQGSIPCVVQQASLTLHGVRLNNTDINQNVMAVTFGGSILANNIIITQTGAGTQQHVIAKFGGSIQFAGGPVTFEGNSQANCCALTNGSISFAEGTSVNFGVQTVTVANMWATKLGTIYFPAATPALVLSGTPNGPRWRAEMGGQIITNGGPGGSWIPGTAPGVLDSATFGIYN